MTKRAGSVKQRNILQYSTALAGMAAFAAVMAPASALAQAAPADDDAIVVTGTRIAQPDFQFSNPVASVDAQTIQQSGVTNLTDFARDMPALLNSFSSEDAADTGNGGSLQGQNLLDLRALGTNRTLVLVDGRRHVAGQEGSAAVDINTIPVDMVERIEILTGGASAVYGADGVTGVVNFVMRDDFEGFQVRGQHGWTEQGGGGSEFVSALWGKNFANGRGNVMVGAEYSITHALDYWERDIIAPGNAEAIISGQIVRGARYLDTSPGGSFLTDCDGDYGWYFTACSVGADDPDTSGPNGTFTGIDYNGDGTPWVDGEYIGGAFMVGGTGSRLEDFNDQLIPDLERWTINTRAHYDFSGGHRLIGEFKWAHTETYFVGQPTYDFGAYVYTDNPFMPASIRNAALAPGGVVDQGEPGVMMFRDNFDLGTLDHDVSRDTFRVVVGLEGPINDLLTYNVSYVYGTTLSDQRYRTRNNERWTAGMDVVSGGSGPECRDNSGGETWEAGTCVPINVFGDGAMSQAAIDWVMTDLYNQETITQSVVSGYISGNTGGFALPGGPIQFVVGAEYREETSKFDYDDYLGTLSAPEDLFWNGQGIDSRGAYHVAEAFAEISLPILRDMSFAKDLTLDAAFRLSNYSTVGETDAWKVGLRYAPIDGLMFRGTLATAVRAPNITELFLPQQVTFGTTGTVDPCDSDNVNDGTALRVTNCINAFAALGVPYDPTTWQNTTSTTIPGLGGGNPNLRAEEAETITYGFVLEPSFLPGLSISVDYWDIELTDAIETLSVRQMAEFCYDFAQPNQYCALIARTPAGVPAYAIPAGGISDFTTTYVNVAAFLASGYDIGVRYRLDPADWGVDNLGEFMLALNATKLESWEFSESALSPSIDRLGQAGRPEWQAMFDATWQIAGFTVNYGYSWFSETDRLGNVPVGYEKWSARSVHDLYVAYDFMERYRIYGGVNNFTEQEPDRASTRAPYPVNEIGRTFFIGARATF